MKKGARPSICSGVRPYADGPVLPGRYNSDQLLAAIISLQRL